MPPLSDTRLIDLPADLAKPCYDRSAVRTGIVHLGVGGFHRAHQAVYLDTLMNEGKALDRGICGVGVLPQDVHLRDVLHDSDGLYTLVLKTRTAGGHRGSSARSWSICSPRTTRRRSSRRWPIRPSGSCR